MSGQKGENQNTQGLGIKQRILNVLWSQLQGESVGFRYAVACQGVLVEGCSVSEFRDDQRCLVEGVGGPAGWGDQKEEDLDCWKQGSV